METSSIDQKKFEIIAKAWSNPDYKRQLLANPKAVIAGEFNVDVPAGISVNVLEDTPDLAHLVLVQPGFLPETDKPDAYAGLIYKAWGDPAFKAALLADPQAAFSQYLQHQLPAKPALKVVEQTDSALYIVIPQRPASLSDAELDQVAGGVSGSQIATYVDAGALIVGGAATLKPGAVIGGIRILLTDTDSSRWLKNAGKDVGHAIGSVAKKIFHGW